MGKDINISEEEYIQEVSQEDEFPGHQKLVMIFHRGTVQNWISPGEPLPKKDFENLFLLAAKKKGWKYAYWKGDRLYLSMGVSKNTDDESQSLKIPAQEVSVENKPMSRLDYYVCALISANTHSPESIMMAAYNWMMEVDKNNKMHNE